MTQSDIITRGLSDIRRRIDEAARRSGREASQVTLVAVCKGQPLDKIKEAVQAGQKDFGENYAQELLAHAEGVETSVRWHFIGHLQRNKVKQILPHVALIHSVDSLELAKEIDKRSAALKKIQPILIEVNLGGETSKSGIKPDKVSDLVRQLQNLEHIDLQGFMTIPPPADNPEQTRPHFRQLREIRDAINGQKIYQRPLTELSMGMTNDFEVAIEEGATLVRIGTGIFGERN